MAKDRKVVKPISPPLTNSSDSDSNSNSSRESSEELSEEQEKVASSLQKGKGKAVQQNVRPQDLRKYRAPSGMKAIKSVDKVSLDIKELEDDQELELWAIRVPIGVKAKYLEGITIQLPSNSSSNGSIGNFTAKKNDYEIFLADAPSSINSSKKRSHEDEEQMSVSGISRGGAEMHSLVALLPNHNRQDTLYQSRPLTKHLLIQRALPSTVLSHMPSSTSSLIASQPSPVPGAILSAKELLNPEIVREKKKLRLQPKLLKMGIKLGGMRGEGGKGLFNNKPLPKVLVEEFEEEIVEMEVDEVEGVESAKKEEVVEKKVKKEKKEKHEKSEKKKEKKVKKEA